MANKIDMAEQQLCGYSYGRRGFSITSLVEAMGLTKKEWERLKSDDYPVKNYLTKSEIEEIDKIF
jgi:hypothetical protein